MTTEYEQLQDLQISFVLEIAVHRVGNESERNRDHNVATHEADYLYIFSSDMKT